MKWSICFLFCAILSAPHILWAKNFEGFVKTGKERSVYVQFQAAQAANAPVLILLNGLTYKIKSWDTFVQNIDRKRYSVLRYDAFGQGKTLSKHGPFFNIEIPYQNQIRDLNRVLDFLGIKGRVHLIGLSYGGGLALAYSAEFPQRVGQVFLMAPYIEPVPAQDAWIRQQIQLARLNPLFALLSEDDLYDYFLKQLVYATYPAAEPVITSHPYMLEAVYKMTKGIRKFSAYNFMKEFPHNSLHVIIAARDQYIENGIHYRFWEELPQNVKRSLIYIEGVEHKIPEDIPRHSAALVQLILAEGQDFSGGLEFVSQPQRGRIFSKTGYEAKLPKEKPYALP